MREHEFSFEVEATPQEVWRALHPRMSRGVIEHGSVRIEIVHPGDDDGLGLVRHCTFRVPKYLLSGGVGRSWEVVTESRPPERDSLDGEAPESAGGGGAAVGNGYSRYEAVGKPLWSRASGWHRIEGAGAGRTAVTFGETYEAFNPLARRLLEARVHRFISADNDVMVRRAVERGVAAQRRRSAGP